MSDKAQALVNVVNDMYALSNSLKVMADIIMGTKDEPASADSAPEEDKTGKKSPPDISIEEVRAALAAKSVAGFMAEVRQLLEKYGAAKLSEVKETDYAALLADAEALSHGK